MEGITINDLSQVVGSLGFPIAVTWFLLTKGSKLVEGITTAINEMKSAVIQLGDRLEKLEKDRGSNG